MSAMRIPDYGRAFVEVGLVPPNATDVEVLMPVNGLMQIRYVVNVEASDLPKLARAFELMAERHESVMK